MWRFARPVVRFTVCAFCVGLAACAGPPPYQKPVVDVPRQWQGPWRPAQPSDGTDKGQWWKTFGDPSLDGLVERALAQSPTVKIALVKVAQGRALLDGARAGLFPSLDAGAKAFRQRTSENRPLAAPGASVVSTTQNDFLAALAVAYEVDLFGRVRSDIAASQASLDQAGADLANVRLLLGADIATAYFAVRSLDGEIDVVRESIAAQSRAVELLRGRHQEGVASGLDVAQQQALLDGTRTQISLLERTRAQFEHALAVLVGEAPNGFSLPSRPAGVSLVVPAVPVGLPSDVLERRPDVAAAERAVAAANARVGVASAGYFPSLKLTGSLGWESRDIHSLFDAPSLVWALGAAAVQTLFDGGRTSAQVRFAEAGTAAAGASYRQVVLRALQEVEDGLSALDALQRAAADAESSVASARRVLDIATDRYAGGLSSYLEVVTAQQNHLASRRVAIQVRGQQLVATAFLFKALGGGWDPAVSESGQAEVRRTGEQG
jgi:outer membrane protein, multidrug efflux system